MNTLINELEKVSNFTETENGAVAHKSTLNAIYDLFAFGAAYRGRSDEDCILLFSNAYNQNPELALKCLFYIRDVLKGQGERRFFRVCYNWLAKNHPESATRNLEFIPDFGRWDDLFCAEFTPVEKHMFDILEEQWNDDVRGMHAEQNISLMAKWLPSCNASSEETKRLGRKMWKTFGLDQEKDYRKTLSSLRGYLNILEKIMSAQEWDDIDFGKIPSIAGMRYSRAFLKNENTSKRYVEYMARDDAKVNTKALAPYQLVEKALDYIDENDKIVLDKYWNNLPVLEGDDSTICVVDTSGSMFGRPMNVAISLGIYFSQYLKGAFKDKYISFSTEPQLVHIEGVDFVHKVKTIYDNSIVDDTNLELVFDLLKEITLKTGAIEDLPKRIMIISDMEINAATGTHGWGSSFKSEAVCMLERATMMEQIREEWSEFGLPFPEIVYWNVDARNNIILDEPQDGITYVSGFSPNIFNSLVAGKTGVEFMLSILESDRYLNIK